MAKRVTPLLEKPNAPPEEIPATRNPDLFGVDLEQAAVMGVGAALSGYANDTVLTPILKPLIASAVPGTAHDSVVTQIADGVTTIGVGAFLGHVAGMFFGAKHGRDVTMGGGVLGMARVLASLVPGYSLNYQFPSIPGLASLTAGFMPAKALPPGSAAASPAANQGRLIAANTTGL